LAPVRVTPLTVSAASPELVRLIFCGGLVVPIAWLAKVSDVGVRVTAGAAADTPVPLRLIVRGLPGSLSVITIVPVRVPAAVGLKVTLMLHDESELTEPMQPLVMEKSAPVRTTLVRVTAVVPWL
jgi:hypothetical protein